MQHTIYLFDGFQLDVTRRTLASSGGLVLPVNSRAMDTLLLLVANAGQLVDKRRIMQSVWPHAIVEDNNLNQCIGSIRRALGETAGSNRFVMTVPGRGYCFVCPVRTINQESQPAPPAQVRHPALQLLAWTTLMVVGATILFQLARIARNPDEVVADTRSNDRLPGITLRLHPVIAAGSGTTAHLPKSSLARCLSQQAGVKLRVVVQLLPANGAAPVWSGEYSASAADILSLQEPPQGSDEDCSAQPLAASNP